MRMRRYNNDKIVRCAYCGREFSFRCSHNCNGNFRKRHLKWIYIKQSMTPADIQKNIDHYYSVATAEKELGNMDKYWFYIGKRDAYINVLDKLHPEIEDRVYPFDKHQHEETIRFVKEIKSESLKL